jgi:hypothetical protein
MALRTLNFVAMLQHTFGLDTQIQTLKHGETFEQLIY